MGWGQEYHTGSEMELRKRVKGEMAAIGWDVER